MTCIVRDIYKAESVDEAKRQHRIAWPGERVRMWKALRDMVTEKMVKEQEK